MALAAITCVLIGSGVRRRSRPYRQARALIALYGKHRQEADVPTNEHPIAKEAKRIANRDGYGEVRVWRVLDADCDGEREVLVRARFKGDQRAGIPGDTDEDLYRVVVKDDGETGYVLHGW